MTRRRGFSLSELVVAIGILVLMFSLAGQVFNLTMKSTSQAVALTETSQLLRAFEKALRDDLAAVPQDGSLILIQGNPINAYWTQGGKDDDGNQDAADGYPHPSDPAREDDTGNMILPRADILMLFTARPAESYADPELNKSLGGREGLQQVVYGHAELGEWVYDDDEKRYEFEPGVETFQTVATASGGRYPAYPLATNIDASPVAAEHWHLARRVVQLRDTAVPPGASTPWGDAVVDKLAGLGPDLSLPNPYMVAQGESDVVGNFDYAELVLTPQSNLVDDVTDNIDDLENVKPQLPPIFRTEKPFELPEVPFARSQLDIAPTPQKARQLGHYFLPNCASFKVEWMLDARSEYVAGRFDGINDVLWFDPGHLTNPLKTLEDAEMRAWERVQVDPLYEPVAKNLTDIYKQTQTSGPADYSLAERFGGVPGLLRPEWMCGPDDRPNTVVFRAKVWEDTNNDSAIDANGEPNYDPIEDSLVQDPIYPSALRITIDVFDKQRQLGKPLRHVMVIPVGGA